MPFVAKRVKAAQSKVTAGKHYPVDEALKLVKSSPPPSSMKASDAAVNLGIDASKSDQQVRGSDRHAALASARACAWLSLPRARTRDAARAAGADIVGLEDLAGEGQSPARLTLTWSSQVPLPCAWSGQAGPDSRPRGLHAEPQGRHRDAGCRNRREEREGRTGAPTGSTRGGIVICTIGKPILGDPALKANSLGADWRSAEGESPATSKGVYLKRVTLSSDDGTGRDD